MIHKQNYVYILLYLLLIVHLIFNSIWLTLNNAPISWDPAGHTWIVLDITEKIKSFNLIGILTSSDYYPIFIHLITALSLIIPLSFLDPIQKIKLIQFAATFHFLITIIAVFYYAKTKLKDERVALVSSIIFSFFPIIFSNSRFIYLDIPQVGLLLLSLVFLEKSHYLIKRKESAIFFIFAGFLIMTKWTGLIYLFLPSLFTIITIVKRKYISKIIQNIVIGSVIFLIITTPWYLINFHSLINLSKINIIGESGADPSNLWSKENFTLYLKLFTNFQVTPIIALTFFISAIYFLIKQFKNSYFFISFIAFNYIAFTFISNKDPRYTMPILPFVSIVISMFVFEIFKKRKHLKTIISTILISYLVGLYLILTFRPAFFDGSIYPVYLPGVGWYANFFHVDDSVAIHADKNSWQMENIIKDLNDLNNSKILIFSQYPNINITNLTTYAKAAKLNIDLTTPDIYFLKNKYADDKFPNTEELSSYITNSDYLLMSERYIGTEYERNGPALDQIRNYFSDNNIPPCHLFIQNLSSNNIICKIQENEILNTSSDVLLNGSLLYKGGSTFKGPTNITCNWGCTFRIVKPSNTSSPTFMLIKSYLLPNDDKLNLYKIIKN